MAIQRRIGHEPFQFGVFFSQLPELSRFAHPQSGIFALHTWKVCSGIPSRRQTSAIVVPPSACCKGARICSSICPRRHAHVGPYFWRKKTTSPNGSSSSRWPAFRVLDQACAIKLNRWPNCWGQLGTSVVPAYFQKRLRAISCIQ